MRSNAAADGMPKCPWCGAAENVTCISVGGTRASYAIHVPKGQPIKSLHAARIRAYEIQLRKTA